MQPSKAGLLSCTPGCSGDCGRNAVPSRSCSLSNGRTDCTSESSVMTVASRQVVEAAQTEPSSRHSSASTNAKMKIHFRLFSALTWPVVCFEMTAIGSAFRRPWQNRSMTNRDLVVRERIKV